MIAGIGADIVDIQRIRNIILRHGDRFVKRVFSDDEIAYCLAKRDPSSSLAARFAAKEALFKALRTGVVKGMGFHDIAVAMCDGRPEVRLSGTVLEIAEGKGIKKIHLSLSHERNYAVAVVVVEV